MTASGCNRDAETELYDLTGRLTGTADPEELDNLTSPLVPASKDDDVREGGRAAQPADGEASRLRREELPLVPSPPG